MTIRKLTLEEWFLDYQLQSVKDDHFHLPFTVDVRLQPLAAPWRARGLRVPLPAIIIKAVGVLARQRPDVNRILFRTPFGPRMVEFEGQHVNVPVLVSHEGREYLTAVTVHDAADRTVESIIEQLKEARKKVVPELMVNAMFIDGRNTLWRRCKLRMLHFMSYRFPWAYVRSGAGGMSVSSLWHRRRDSLVARGVSFGPSTFTVSIFSSSGEGDDELIQLGVGFDHAALPGDALVSALGDFTDILASPEEHGLGPAPEA